MAAWLPLMVRVPLPLAPLLMVAPPLKVTVSVPWLTLSWVLAKSPLPSATEMLLIASEVFSTALCAPGTLLIRQHCQLLP
ncbi:MAG: hypothetical protein IPJ05_00230 [Nitrosomonas sp.]|nr:hypothetical protein [Nitrosomonas sp.]